MSAPHRHAVLVLAISLCASPVLAWGWNDYRLEIAPGFAVERMNSFLVCLAGPPEGLLLVCPDSERPTFGPLVEYAVTPDAIITRHLGAKGHSVIDRSQEFFFHVRRQDGEVQGPLTRKEWERFELPTLSSLPWVEPRNPVLGESRFLGFGALYLVSPPLLLGLVVLAAIAWIRMRARRRGASA